LKKKINKEDNDHFPINPEKEYLNALLAPLEKEQNSIKANEKIVTLRLLSYLLPYKKELVWGGIGAVFATIIALVPAYLSGNIIDDIIRPFQDGKLDKSESLKMAWLILGTLGIAGIAREFFIWLRLNKMSKIGEKVSRDLREELYTHMQTLGMDFFSSKQTGSLISRVSSDTDRIWDFIAFGIVEVSISLLMLGGLSTMLISLDMRLGLILTLPVPIFLLSIYFHGEKMNRIFLKAWRKWSNMTDVLSDTIPGVQVVKAFNQERKETKRFNDANNSALNVFNSLHDSWTSFWPRLMLGFQFIILSVWFFAIPRLIGTPGDEHYLSAGVFVSFLLYMTMFSHPIEVIGQMARMLNRATSSAFRIFEILDTKPTMEHSQNPIRPGELKGDISFKDVSFSYDGIRTVLNKINFELQSGQMIGLVGPSGSGKSTITKLMTRFYDPIQGEIKIDGVNLKEMHLGDLRRQVGVVLQDPYLFHGSIKDNIAYGRPGCSLDDIIKAAKSANAHEFIIGFPEGYDTTVGERGQTLSGGERQRISIARAIVHNPKILILDEATSSVDTETERKIQEAIDLLIAGRTVIAIAHRLSTLRKADRLLVIEKGQLKEEGTHDELINIKGGIYQKLQFMQGTNQGSTTMQ